MNHRKVNEQHREAHKTRLYKIWCGMRERCNRVNHSAYKNYGGRGIKVCLEWDDYVAFREWATNNGYSNELTLDRIDVDGNYCPENCRWVTMDEQHKNRRDNNIVDYKGQRYILADLARLKGIGWTTLKYRLQKGWSVEDAVEKPIRLRTKGYRMSRMGE